MESSPTRDQTSVSCIAKWILNPWTTRKPFSAVSGVALAPALQDPRLVTSNSVPSPCSPASQAGSKSYGCSSLGCPLDLLLGFAFLVLL